MIFALYTWISLLLLSRLPLLVHGHVAFWHPSEWGFNVTMNTFSYDNRPVAPLAAYNFSQWWFHGHLDYPPNPGDFFELPAGRPATAELACDKGATSFFASDPGGDVRQGDSPCPNSPTSAYHTTGFDDLFGCALAITYESDVNQVKPEDFSVFSVNQTCVWTRFTDFQVPARMPPCPPGGCICAWFWIHSPDSGGEQNYMNGFRCNVTGSTSSVALAKPQLPRRCGADPANNKMEAAPGNCTYGAKQPFYWFQNQSNNMFEGTYSPPRYKDMYNFLDGAQNDIFEDSYPEGLPPPSPNSTFVPTPFLGGVSPPVSASAYSSYSSATSAPASDSVGSASSSVASPPTSLSASSASHSSSSISASTVTVLSTAVVTVTASATPTSSPSSVAPSNTPITSTVFSTVVVTVVNTNATESAATSSSAVTATSSAIVYTYVTDTASGDAPPALNTGVFREPAEFERVISSSVTSGVVTSPSSTPTTAVNAAKVCKRTSSLEPASLKRRSESYFSMLGVGSHRKLRKKSSLWNLF